jgi:tetratricopeptide (TPR) repeat protein/predicted RNase H-like HicB family nuclease
MLVEYILAVMKKAVVLPNMEDGTFTGEIPGFSGLTSTATSEEDCRESLQKVLEQWVVFRASQDLDLPDISGLRIDIPKSEINTRRLERIQQLEREIEAIRLEIGGINKPATFWSKADRLNTWYKNYFPLITACIGVIVIVIAYFVYRVKPWQTYQDNLTKQVVTDYYRELGDRFMNYGEFDAAAEAYQEALNIDKYDTKSNTGLRTAQIFQPQKGDAFSSPVATDVRLVALYQTLGNKKEYAHLVLNSEGINLRRQRDCSGAKDKFQQAINRNASFVDAYNQLGYTNLILDEVDIGVATANFESARDRDPNHSQVYAPTLRDLGYCYLVQGRVDEAIQYLSEAHNRLGRAEISIKLGDAYRNQRNLQQAHYYHQLSLDGIDNVVEADERYYLGPATFVYLLEGKSQKAFVQAEDRNQYKVLALYTLSFDNALDKDFAQASRRFDEAFKLDANHLYSKFVAYQIQSLKTVPGLIPSDGQIMIWFDRRLKGLNSIEPFDERVSKMCDK